MLASLLALILAAQLEEPLVMSQESEAGKQILQLQNGVLRTLTAGRDWHLYPDISSDRSHVVYVEGEPPNRLVYQEVASGTRRVWPVPAGHTALQPRLSGDGRKLAFSLGAPDKHARIACASVPSGEGPLEWKLLDAEGDGYFPDLSSDGSFLVYQRNLNGKKEVVRYQLDTRTVEVLAQGTSPALSADDRYLAFARSEQENWDVHVLDLWEKRERRVTDHPGRDLAASFQADGSLLFASDRSGRFQIYRLAPGWDAPALPVQEIAGATYAPRAAGAGFRSAFLAPIPGPARSSFGCAADSGHVYLCGGHQGREHSYPPESFSDRLDIYDLAQKRWRSGSPRPVKAHGYTLISSGSHLYAFGGFCYSEAHQPRWKSIDTIDRYDLAHDRWETVGRLPRARSSNAAVEFDGKVYLFGGWDSTPRHAKDRNGLFHREVDVFDLRTGQVQANLTQLPDPLRRAFTAVRRGDEILLIGGLGASADHFKLLDQVTAYNPRTGAWRELPRLPFATFAPAAGAVGDDVYVMGGMFRQGERDYRYVNHIFRLSGSAGWTHTGRYLSETKGFSQVVPLGPGGLGVLGGHRYLEDGSDQPTDTFETLEIDSSAH